MAEPSAPPQPLAAWLTALLRSPASPEPAPPLPRAQFASFLADRHFPSTLVDLAYAFPPPALPPAFPAALLAALRALQAALLPQEATQATPLAAAQASYAAHLRAGLEALAAHLEPAFAAAHARIGLPFAAPRHSATRATVFSTVSCSLLPLLGAREAAALRAACAELRTAVAAHAWADLSVRPRTLRCLARWRACFPRAQAVNLSCLKDAADAGLLACAPSLRGLRGVDLTARQGITGDCFAALLAESCLHLNLSSCRSMAGRALAGAFAPPASRLHTLDVSDCAQLLDEHLAPLRSLAVLRAQRCNGLTGAFVAGFAGGRLRELNLSGCENARFGSEETCRAFSALRGLHTLSVARCPHLRDAHFAALAAGEGAALRVLDMSSCAGEELTGGAFAHLRGLEILYMGGCVQASMTGEDLRAAFAGSRSLKVLAMSLCTPTLIRAARALELPVRT